MDKIQRILGDKFSKNQLAHFYLITPNQIDQEQFLEAWTFELLQSFTSKEILNHPDFLHISSEEDKKFYKWEEFSEVFNFLKYKAIEWRQKFIVISDAHKINEIISNKLLKVLEEPPTECTFIMLNPLQKKLLDTIQSRAIEISIPYLKDIGTTSISELDRVKGLNLQDFIELLKTNPNLEDSIIHEALLKNSENLDLISSLQEVMRIKQTDLIYYNSPSYRLFKVYQSLNQFTMQ